REIEKTGNEHFLFVLGQVQTLVHLVLGDWDAAEVANRAVAARIAVGNGSFPVPDYYLFAGLLLCRRARSATDEARAELVVGIAEHVAALATFAAVCAPNFAHKHKLLLAELARVERAPTEEVMALYAEALAAAGDDFLHLRALAFELQAELWSEKEQPQLARECLLEAYHLYRHWGARAKVARLEAAHRAWFERANLPRSAARGIVLDTMVTATVTSGVEGSSLDVQSAIKATHAISSEVKAERLFSLLVQTMIENAGAEHGYLIVKADGSDELSVAAQASVAENPACGELPLPLDRFEPIAHELVRYVARTHETIVLDDAREDELYKNDAHVVAEGVQSVLCMPIVHQGTLKAILYVENSALSRAFTPARVSLLRVIAGQAAISIANADLYEHLEQKVEERTRELAERNREVTAMLNSLEQGVFTIDERLAIEPRYSAHLEALLGGGALAGRDCIDALFAGAELEKAALDNMRAALTFSFGASPVFAEANRSHWVREFERRTPDGERRHFELDWTPIADGDDSVCKILVAVRDVTLVKALSAKAAEHARELEIVGQVLDASVEQFRRLTLSARRALAHGRERIEREPPSAAVAGELFRHLHTLKGNARMLGLTYLAQTVHTAEEPFDARFAAQAPELRRAELLAAIDTVLASIDEYESVCRQKLGEVLEPARRDGEALERGVTRQLELVKAGSLDANAALAAIEALLERAGAVSFAAIVKSSARVLPALAEETGKVAPAVELEEPGLTLPCDVADALGDALIHAFTNALDHGLETAEERSRRGKPAQGKIRVNATRTALGTSISIRDDGRGLAVDALRERGTPADSDEIAAERIFAAGVSTARSITASSGRGVGLDAVRALLRRLGGDAHAVFTGPLTGGHRPFELVLELPPEDARPSRSMPPRGSDLPPRPSRPSNAPRRSWPPPGAS
ncbi:MAG TPA: GAF domain-containing protein, partial [Polyangiaceae bacterium]|nr:GAF domain-containing protein [Polyangiaceae bacterium]